VHASPTPFRMSPTLRTPDATAFSAHRRAADQNAILCAAQQKRFGEPPRRGRNGRLHHRHSGKVIMRNSSAVTEGGGPPRALPTRLERLGYRLDHRRQPFAGKFAKIGQLAKPAPAQRCRLTCTRIATSRHMPAAMRTASGSVPDDASRRVRFGRPGRALNRPTWSPVNGSSARVSTIRSATVVRQRFFGIPATDTDIISARHFWTGGLETAGPGCYDAVAIARAAGFRMLVMSRIRHAAIVP